MTLTSLPIGLALGLTRQEIATRAEDMTVRIQQPRNGQDGGTGILVDRQSLGSGRYRYTVLTNCHVIKRISGSLDFRPLEFGLGVYEMRVQGQTYTEELTAQSATDRCHPTVDLALLYFEANQAYAVAAVAATASIRQLQVVYGSGFPNLDGVAQERALNIREGAVQAVMQRAKEGYQIRHSIETDRGMSGGPIVDEEGAVVGVLGRAAWNDVGVSKWNYYGAP